MRKSDQILLLAAAAVLLIFLVSRHTHVPGEAATCTEGERCALCGRELAPPLDHTPGEAATCTEGQTCTVCGAELSPPLGHTPGEAATCTEGQTCAVCGAELAPPLGHTPGEAATCTEGQTCTVCGVELAPPLAHQLNSDDLCTVCGKWIGPSAARETPGDGGADYDGAEVLPETEPAGHYHNNISAYYKNYVLVCGDYALEYFDLGTEGYEPYARVVSNFARRYPALRVTSVIVPKCCAFQSPDGYRDLFESTSAYINSTYAMMDPSVHTADVIGTMADHAGEYMFYRTDHHWTGLGAYYASAAYCRANGIEPYDIDSYKTVINTDFIGTLYGFAGRPDCLTANPDYTVGHFPHTAYRMAYKRGGTWYGATAINPSAKGYAEMYLGGDQPLTVMETEVNNGKVLLVFKESYGNAFAPYMLDYYQRVVVMDIREQADSVAEIIERYGVTDVAIINNLQGAVSLCDTLEQKLAS